MTGNPGPSDPREDDASGTSLTRMQFAVPMNKERRPTERHSSVGWSEGDGKGSDAAAGVGRLDFPVALRDGTFTGNFFPSRVILTFCPARIPNSKGTPPWAIKSSIQDIHNPFRSVIPKRWLRFR